jgi:uncharacterized protein YggU (UPF0235/DUF167 family)
MADVRISVRAKPRASRSAVVRASGLTTEIAVRAAPVDGSANEALREVLAEALALPRSALRLQLGASSKHKVFEVTGLAEDDVVLRLARAAASNHCP